MIPVGEFYALYPYGSRVYGTHQSYSDYDYIAVKDGAEDTEMEMGQINLKIMSPNHFQYLLQEHHISVLEAYFLPQEIICVKPVTSWNFKLSLEKLRHSFSQKASHSFVKAKKKMEVPYEGISGEFLRGKKSLFHSLRILQFGIQIAQNGKISNYASANDIFAEIINNPSTSWIDYQKKWKPIYNQLATEFRKLAPKDL